MNYSSIQGDTWDGIAYKLYGSERHMTTLMAANPDIMAIVVFPAGVQVIVPVLAAEAALKLPPWKRGT
ncbi:Phage Tail Protein X [compost metagenome]